MTYKEALRAVYGDVAINGEKVAVLLNKDHIWEILREHSDYNDTGNVNITIEDDIVYIGG